MFTANKKLSWQQPKLQQATATSSKNNKAANSVIITSWLVIICGRVVVAVVAVLQICMHN